MKIPFSPPYITDDDIKAVVSVLKSGWLSMGPLTIEFEKMFARYIGSKHAISTNSCTSALFLSLKALGVKTGDEVITTPFTFAATANTIVHCGAEPIFVDIDEKTYNIDPEKIEEKITEKTKAIVVVHYGGQPADMKKINKIGKQYQIPIIEDAAHAVGSCYENGKKVGNTDNIVCFSFYPTKPMTTGEGGMITLKDDILAEEIRKLRLHGINRNAWNRYIDGGNTWWYEVVAPGYKCNTTDINAALGISQLKKLEWMNRRRGEISRFYNESLKDLDLVLPYVKPKVKSSHHLYPIRTIKCDRNRFILKMAEKGIQTSVHFIPLNLMPYYQDAFGYGKGDFPVAESVFNDIVSLPIHPHLNEKETEYVVKSIKEILEAK
ncbi:MAG: DegT/DnrJ/EryC1/StrS family aminotransferase [Candidatus Odinarchaeota archaeon]|nr:DegT/DnrJ/EryC1/StrS family aminotransferase [Candidatus Odinarchaeota archaeon]